MILSVLLDPSIVIPVVGLFGTSIALIFSTTPTLLPQQLIFFAIGFFLFTIFVSVDYRVWTKFSWIFYILSIAFLLTSFLGPSVRGSTRWIDIGITRLQPSELIKPFITVFLAYQISRERSDKLLSLLKVFLLFFPIILLIFNQPDLGNVLVFLFTFLALEIMNGMPLKYLLFSTAALGAIFPLLWMALKEYQRVRFLSFLNPYADPIGTGYNALQAMIALGSGQLVGLGLGRGTQSHLLFLPEYHTDFVFASLGEELGFIGGAAVLVFYFILLLKILLVAARTDNSFGKLICIGSFAQLFIQVFINIGMNLGLLPITGITLPLLSYGGSSIVSTFISLGFVLAVAKTNSNRTPIVIR